MHFSLEKSTPTHQNVLAEAKKVSLPRIPVFLTPHQDCSAVQVVQANLYPLMAVVVAQGVTTLVVVQATSFDAPDGREMLTEIDLELLAIQRHLCTLKCYSAEARPVGQ